MRRLLSAVAWRARAVVVNAQHFWVRLGAWLAFRRAVSRYRVLSESELLATRKSDTVFIFGSGASLNAVTDAEWRDIETHDTVGFNFFVHQNFVRCDYQFVREVGPTDLVESGWRPQLTELFQLARSNPRFSTAIFLIQTGFRATNGNRAIGLRLAPPDRPVFLWRSLVGRDTPSPSFKEGLTHASGTLIECVNFAMLMGWTRIVLAGVDLYDQRYFWLPPDQARPGGIPVETPHPTAQGGVPDILGRWRVEMQRRGISLYVYNPKSLLAAVMPTWPRVTPA